MALFNEIGRKNACGTGISLLSFSDGARANELVSDEFIRLLNPNTIYITMGKSIDTLREEGVDTSRIFWIDATGKGPSASANISATEGPRSLVQLSIMLSGMAASGNFSFAVFDSLDDLILRNGKEKALKFALYMVKSLSHRGIGALIAIRNRRAFKAFARRLARECDAVIEA
jgi:hypothetical protein